MDIQYNVILYKNYVCMLNHRISMEQYPWNCKQWYFSEVSFCILKFSKISKINLHHFYHKKVKFVYPIWFFFQIFSYY